MRRPLLLLLPLLALACGDDSSPKLDGGEASTSASPTGTESGSSSGTTTDESSDSGSESSTTGPMPCMSDEECTDADAPFCGTAGECGTCEGTASPDAACAGVDAMAPLCVGDACVQCTAAAPEACTGETPVCDDATNTCVPCVAHDECGEAACNLYTGACLPADAVAHVGGATPDFATLTLAVGSFPAGAEGTIIVHEGMPDYNESVTVDGGRVLAFLAAEDAAVPPRWILGAGGAPQLTVTTGSTVLIDGLRMSGNANDVGLMVDNAFAWVDRSRIVQNSGGGVVAQNGAELTLRNCFVGGSVNVVGLEVMSASATVHYSTVTASTFGTTPALGCTTPVAVDLRNSIIVSQGGTSPDELSCPPAVVTNIATEADVGFDTGWFADFDNGDFHLTASGATAFANIARWTTGDPATDIDGDLRPCGERHPRLRGRRRPVATYASPDETSSSTVAAPAGVGLRRRLEPDARRR